VHLTTTGLCGRNSTVGLTVQAPRRQPCRCGKTSCGCSSNKNRDQQTETSGLLTNARIRRMREPASTTGETGGKGRDHAQVAFCAAKTSGGRRCGLHKTGGQSIKKYQMAPKLTFSSFSRLLMFRIEKRAALLGSRVTGHGHRGNIRRHSREISYDESSMCVRFAASSERKNLTGRGVSRREYLLGQLTVRAEPRLQTHPIAKGEGTNIESLVYCCAFRS